MKKIIISLLFILSSQFSVGDIESSLGPNNKEFVSMCQPVLNSDDNNEIFVSECFIYFVGMRNGYLAGEYRAIERAALYYELDGDLPADGELEFSYIKKSSNRYDHPAFIKMTEHRPSCARDVDPVVLLKEFIEFAQSIKRKSIGATAVFYEFLTNKYAGQC